MARVRYFYSQRRRPGLPKDVAALVEKIEAERTVLRLINLSAIEERDVIVQAGAFAEHQFTTGAYQTKRADQIEDKIVAVNDKCFYLHLMSGTEITLDIGTRCFVHDPTYDLPW